MFSSRVSQAALASWCRTVGQSLAAGVSLTRALEKQAGRRGSAVQRLSQALLDHLRDGDDLPGALQQEADRLPPLVVSMGQVAASTGRLPEVLKELANYYDFQVRLRRQFLSQIFWPVMQLVIAVGIIGLLIFVIGAVAGDKPEVDLLGFGVYGAAGATRWFAMVGSAAAAGYCGFMVLRYGLKMPWVDHLLLSLPVLGEALRMLAMARLCFAMHVTMDSPLPPQVTLPMCFAATDNQAFIALADPAVDAINRGQTIYEALRRSRLFPDDFLDALDVAEESGQIPESMGRLAGEFNERAEMRMAALNIVASWLVWLGVACIILYFVFRMFMGYVGMLNEAMDMKI